MSSYQNKKNIHRDTIFHLLYFLPPLLIATALFSNFTTIIDLDPSAFRQDQGKAWTMSAPIASRMMGILTLAGDNSDHPLRSTLQLFENDRTLGPSHSLHDSIRSTGGGLYSHWRDYVVFSTSDNSDPRLNGRHYKVTITYTVSNWMWTVLLILQLLSLMYSPIPLNKLFIRRALMAMFNPLCEPHSNFGRALFKFGVFGSSTFLFCYKTAEIIYGGETRAFVLAGMLSLTDAELYVRCALLINDGIHRDPVCSNRPIYIVLLSLLFKICNSNINCALIAQAFIASIVSAFTTIEIAKSINIFTASLFLLSLFLLVDYEMLGEFTTETPGVIFGVLAIFYIFRSIRLNSPSNGVLAVALITTAEAARSGAVLVVPVIVIWYSIYWYSVGHKKGVSVLFSIVGAGIGIIFAALCLLYTGQGKFVALSNFSLVLYGLSTNRDWTAFWNDFPSYAGHIDEQAFGIAFSRAIDNIITSPSVLFQAMMENASRYYKQYFLMYLSLSKTWNIFFTLIKYSYVGAIFLIPMAVIRCVRLLNKNTGKQLFDITNNYFIFLVAGSFVVCELLSCAIIGRDGGSRVFVVTAMWQILFPLIGIGAIVKEKLPTVFIKSEPRYEMRVSVRDKSKWKSMSALTVASLLVCYYFTIPKKVILSDLRCPDSLQKITMQIGVGSNNIFIAADDRVSDPMRGIMNYEDLTASIPRNWWFRDELHQVRGMNLVFGRAQKENGDPIAMGYYSDPGSLPPIPRYARLSMCVDLENPKAVWAPTPAINFRIASYELLQ